MVADGQWYRHIEAGWKSIGRDHRLFSCERQLTQRLNEKKKRKQKLRNKGKISLSAFSCKPKLTHNGHVCEESEAVRMSCFHKSPSEERLISVWRKVPPRRVRNTTNSDKNF